MSFTYIGKALAAINSVDKTGRKGDWAAYRVGTMPESAIAELDSFLDAGWLRFRMRAVPVIEGNSRGRLADLRRGAQLMQRLTGEPAPTTDFDDGVSSALIRAVEPNQLMPVAGYYFTPSVWAFATRNERTQLSQAWDGAIVALTWGIEAVQLARLAAGPARDVYQRWFGQAAFAAVEATLTTIRTGITDHMVRICYQGLGSTDGGDWPLPLLEKAKTNILTNMKVADVYGWAIAERRTIGFGPNFFNHKSKLRLTRQHDVASAELGATRFGAMVHELSHLLAATVDLKVPDEVYVHLQRALPAEHQRLECYGPLRCAALAAAAPALALVNADNYRLLCEEALYRKPEG